MLSATVRDGGITPGGGGPTPDGTARESLAAGTGILPLHHEHRGSERWRRSPPESPTRCRVDGTGWVNCGLRRRRHAGHRADATAAIQSRLGVSIVSPTAIHDAVPVFADDPELAASRSRLVTAPMPKGVWAAQLPTGRSRPATRSRGQRPHGHDPGRHLRRVAADRLRAGAARNPAALAVRDRGHRAAGARPGRGERGRIRRGSR